MAKSRQIISALLFLVPLIVWTGLSNAFVLPKNILILLGISALIVISYDKLKAMPWQVAALILFNVLSLLYTSNPYYTKVAVIFNISCLLMYYFVSLEKTVETFFSIITISGVLVSIETWLEFFKISFLLNLGPLTGTIGNPNFLGNYLVFPMFIAIGMFLVSKGWRKTAYALMGVIIISAFIIVRARASWLGAGLAIPVFLYLLGIKGKSLLLLCLVGIFSTYAAITIFPKKIGDPTTLRYRITGYFPAAIEMVKKHPVIGTGMWSYRNGVYDAQVSLQKKTEKFFDGDSEFKPRRVHNDYLEILIDGGIVYALLCMAFVGNILRKGFKVASKRPNPLLAASITVVIAILISAMFFFPFRVNVSLFMFCATLGIVDNLCLDSF